VNRTDGEREELPTDPIARMERGLKITTWLCSAGAILTALSVLILVTGRVEGNDRVHLEQVLFTAWTLGPPCWFILQNHFWPPAPSAHDRFEHHQGLVRAVWAGTAAFLAAIAFGRWA